MAINSRAKGAAFERKVASLFTEATGNKWGRTPGSGAFATRTGMQSLQGDIFCEEDCDYLVEIKAYEKIPLHLFPQKMKSCLITKWLDKLIDQCILASKRPILVFKENRGKIMCLYSVDDMEHRDNQAVYYTFRGTLLKLTTLEDFLSRGLL